MHEEPPQPCTGQPGDDAHDARAWISAGVRIMHYVQHCPYRFMRVPNYCDEVPADFMCYNYDCWIVGERAIAVNWPRLTELQQAKFIQELVGEKCEGIEQLFNQYVDQHSHPA